MRKREISRFPKTTVKSLHSLAYRLYSYMDTVQQTIGTETSTKPLRRNRRKKQSLMRRSIEEEMGERWGAIEERLTRQILQTAKERGRLIRSSPLMISVAEMILGHKPEMEIVRFLRKHDTQRFGDNINDDALLQQVLRFKKDVVYALESETDDDFSTSVLDFYARLLGKHVDAHAMISKVVLFQESRLCKALVEENISREAWYSQRDDTRAKRQFDKAWKKSTKELERYMKFLLSLGSYELTAENRHSY